MTTKPETTVVNPNEQLPHNGKDHHMLYHDLQGPVINIKGFSAEIHITLSQLHDLLAENRDHLPPDLFARMEQLILSDLIPCINYLDSSNESLGNRVMSLISANDEDMHKSPKISAFDI